MSRIRLTLIIPLMLVTLLFIPEVAVAEGITTFGPDDYMKEIEAGESATFTWVIYNNHTSQLIVTPSLEPLSSSSLSSSFEPAFDVIGPGDWTNFTLRISSERNMETVEQDITVSFLATRMDSPEEFVAQNGTAHLKVLSLFGTTAGENKLFGIWENPLPPPLETNYGAFAVTLVGWFVIALFIMYVMDPILHHFTGKTQTELDDRILRIIRGPIFLIVVLYGVVNSLEILNLPFDVIATMELVYSILLTVLLAWLAYKVYDSVIIYYGHRYSRKTDTTIDDVLVPLLEKVGMVVIPLIGVVVIINLLGYDVTVLLAGMGLVSLVVAFAAQDTLSNFFSGLSILLDRPFKMGDTLLLDTGEVCRVTRIGMRSTTLYDIFKNEEIVLPNNEMATKRIVNMVRPDAKYKTSVKVGVAYGSDVQLVKRLMLEAAEEHPNVLSDENHPVLVRFSSFGDSSLDFTLFVWVDDINNQWKVASDLREAIDAKFRKAGVEIPFPQRTVWFHDMSKLS